MFKGTAETFAKNCVHTIKVNKTDNKSVLWIKMIDIQKKLDVKNIHDLVDKEIKSKFETNNLTEEHIKKYKIHRSELIGGETFMYAHEGFIIPVIMHCRTPESYKFKRNLEFKLHDVNCKKQTVLESIKYLFGGEDMQTQYNEVDELRHMIEILTMKYKDKRQQKNNLVMCLL